MISDDIYSFTKTKNKTKKNTKLLPKKIRSSHIKNTFKKIVASDIPLLSEYQILNNSRLKKLLFDVNDNKSGIEENTESRYFSLSKKKNENFNVSTSTISKSSTVLPTSQNLTNYQNDLVFGRFKLWVLIAFSLFYGILIVALIIICRIDLKVRNTTVACRKKTSKYDSDYSKTFSNLPPSLTPPKFHDENDIKDKK
uniref:Uncharacterized protein n=1 Tax=Strongyloides venezuelensis TaxID=75913 RepID=A0A0K0FAH7_STRVS